MAVCDFDDGDDIDIVEVIADLHCYYDIIVVVGCIGFVKPMYLFNNNNNNINNK